MHSYLRNLDRQDRFEHSMHEQPICLTPYHIVNYNPEYAAIYETPISSNFFATVSILC